ncbi:GTPase-activating protein GYP7 isoform X2 [Arabidopsis lyrata subsp. lyrata]|uniref:GTPase-activating protein GYP7 isoform X2 n=1 Tax=Arabidopsis lyrata subsp. lyrata TaxID=81972 RepID=UPI000A29C513|nr:GTPase-activating protein GYP7 isoform X2 [Arabidopsis lyrata subsp. lyrata]|eukprot:XP_020881721.1 GTPase-activating protein GYP7 isoform X2 [Arabidopsis lyrata subsp. lyrata]
MKALRRIQTTSSSSNPSSPLSSPPSSSSSWIQIRSALFVVASSSPASCSSDRPRLKSPWSRRRRKRPLRPQQWKRFFTPDGRLRNGGVDLLKKVRSRGIEPSIRLEVWPFLLGVKEYERLRRQCKRLQKHNNGTRKLNRGSETIEDEYDWPQVQDTDSSCSDEVVSARESLSSDEDITEDIGYVSEVSCTVEKDDGSSSRRITNATISTLNSESSDSDSSNGSEVVQVFQSSATPDVNSAYPASSSIPRTEEDFVTWQRIIRLDAVRANSEWTPYSPSQAVISEDRACRAAEAVGLKDYNHLEPYKIFQAARLVAVLEAYALYDPDIGYCQGMSDLLSPILSVIPDDHEVFWCFVGFMKKARHNFRLDEVGIRRQLNIVSKIIKSKDSQLYRHLEKLQAEDCFFVYRMVVVMFRRELTLDQTLCLWEVMWADQAAIRAGMGKSAWSRIRQRAPPTDDLVLYAIAASVLQRRKLIIEKYNSMDEILRECQSMAGQLDVWKLLDDAHDLVVTLHTKIEHSFS